MSQKRQTVIPLSPELSRLEELPSAVIAYGRDLARGEVLPLHKHPRAQLVYASSGVMTVSTKDTAYIVPPHRAVWMPAGTDHSIDAQSKISMRSLYIDPALSENRDATLPKTVCVLHVTPLLRELINLAFDQGPEFPPDSPQGRLMSVIIDQLSSASISTLSLPIPAEERLQRLTAALIADPADNRTLGDWAREIGASKRTIERLFIKYTDMSFRAWRQQRRLLFALELLAAGKSVTTVAIELQYESTSAFIAMFKRNFGTTPKRYLNTSQSS